MESVKTGEVKIKNVEKDETIWSATDNLMTVIILFLVGSLIFTLAFIFFVIYFANIKFNFSDDVTDPGQVGDIIGGVSAPIVGLIGALLTFLAFWIQFSFNKFQTIKIEQQGVDSKRSRFEGLFYEMLKIHRENVSEISIKDVSKNRRAFISMFKEFKFCYYILIDVYKKYKIDNPNYSLDDNKLVNIGFITFFFGIGESSEDIVNSLLKHYNEDFRLLYYGALEEQQEIWLNLKKQRGIHKNTSSDLFSAKDLTLEVKINEEKTYKLTAGYKPFAGHLGRLGHYFRHLYQIVDFIERQNPENKDEYIRTLRAQISAHEQLLLYYNSLTVMGEPWWNKGYLKNYKMVKNIPLPLANIEPIPSSKLGFDYFEWNEITSSLAKNQIIDTNAK